MHRTTTRITVATLAAAILATAGTGTAYATTQAFMPPPTACDTSPYCYSYTTSGGLKLASKAGYATEVTATTTATENGLNDSAWYASAGPSHIFRLFRGGAPTGLYLNVSGGHLVLGHDATQAFTFSGTANPDGTYTGTWSDSAGRIWTATSNGGQVSVQAPGVVPTDRQLWTTAKPTG